MQELNLRRPKDLSEVISVVRKRKGITQEDLAQEAEISRDYLIALESGRSTKYMTRPLKVMRLLGIKVIIQFDTKNMGNEQAEL